MPLTDLQIKGIKPSDKPNKLTDGGGMFLLITPQGQRYWRLKYRFGGKEKLLALGVYPDVTIKAARQLREDAKKQIASGIDPSDARKAKKASQQLEGKIASRMSPASGLPEMRTAGRKLTPPRFSDALNATCSRKSEPSRSGRLPPR